MRGVSLWTTGPLPRTEGTRKLKRAAIRQWVDAGGTPEPRRSAAMACSPCSRALPRDAPCRGDTTLEALGLSSLERVELMVALEDKFQTRIDETKFAGARTLGELKTLLEAGPTEADRRRAGGLPARGTARCAGRAGSAAPACRPGSCRSRASSPGFASSGLEHLKDLEGPVMFAANHQSHLDVPVILAALPGAWRARTAPAMAKEFFKAHFFPEQFTDAAGLTNSLNYYLAAFFFNAFPLAAARGRRAADAALHRRGDRRRLLGADLSGRACGRTPARSGRSAAASG